MDIPASDFLPFEIFQCAKIVNQQGSGYLHKVYTQIFELG